MTMAPVGSDGQKRPASDHANAVRIAKILTGELEEEYVDPKDKPPPEKSPPVKSTT